MRRTFVAVLVCLLLCAACARGETVDGAVAARMAEIDKAVERGLAYLAKIQLKDGSFPAQYGKTTGVVSLCGMAYLAKGHTPGQGPYGAVINRCVDYVLSHQNAGNGYFGAVGGGKMYSHCIATLFLSEVSGMLDPVRQRKADPALEKATRLILDAQRIKKGGRNQGGWRYEPKSGDSDLSCSGWALMALRSAKLNGAPVPDQAIADAVKYIKGCGHSASGGFGYTGPSPSPVLTGAALLCLELTGHHGTPMTTKAGDYILGSFKSLPGQGQAPYGIYYSSQATFQLGGKYWRTYSSWMYDYLLKAQKKDGSWNIKSYGATYNTAMVLLAFAVPYRQLPIYQRDETVDQKKKS